MTTRWWLDNPTGRTRKALIRSIPSSRNSYRIGWTDCMSSKFCKQNRIPSPLEMFPFSPTWMTASARHFGEAWSVEGGSKIHQGSQDRWMGSWEMEVRWLILVISRCWKRIQWRWQEACDKLQGFWYFSDWFQFLEGSDNPNVAIHWRWGYNEIRIEFVMVDSVKKI